MLLLRHASAGSRDRRQRDDGERPLDDRGRAQAAALNPQRHLVLSQHKLGGSGSPGTAAGASGASAGRAG